MRRRTFPRILPALALMAGLPMPLSPAKAETSPPAYIAHAELERRYGLPYSRFTMIEGARIHYTDQGKGPVIVLLHGSSGSLRTYDRVVPRLVDSGYRVIRYDEPNMGLSGPAPQALYDRPLYPVVVLEGMLAKLNVRSATFVGVSSGGSAAFFFAARHPQQVERLVLSNTPMGRADGKGMTLSRDLARELALSTPGQGRKSKIYRPLFYWQAFFRFFTGEPDRVSPALLTQYYDMNRREPVPDRLAMVEALDDAPGVAAALDAVTAPTLLLWGARDPVLPPESAADLKQALHNTQVSTLMMPDVGHYPPLEVPERFADSVLAYLRSVTPVRPKAPPPSQR
ncbi:alpha/beta fold hydrolase [Novosphingobium sp. P6W]|uniref:alpha/beta fold hydrolase n=1 Tax=Novosphingobium sp. P6W TaxID=1609758 RepID=UPI0005C501C8|nr:alpha/beta hydrolase [Novosphingobium sp. P6W]